MCTKAGEIHNFILINHLRQAREVIPRMVGGDYLTSTFSMSNAEWLYPRQPCEWQQT